MKNTNTIKIQIKSASKVYSRERLKLTDNFDSDVEAGHLGAVRVSDGGVSIVGSTGKESSDEVGDLGKDF